jgi:prephenate dehydrogenase
MTIPLRRVTVVGLGLIGGSIAKALRLRDPNLDLLAVDRGDVGKRSDVKQLVTEFIAIENIGAHHAAIAQSDLVVLCQPVRVIASSISSYVRSGCVVTDTGSTKRHIVEATRKLPGAPWYVPGHPMAGKERGGFENANPDLFVGRPWIVCREYR